MGKKWIQKEELEGNWEDNREGEKEISSSYLSYSSFWESYCFGCVNPLFGSNGWKGQLRENYSEKRECTAIPASATAPISS